MSITPLEWYNHSLIQLHLHHKGLYIYINHAQSATVYTVSAVITNNNKNKVARERYFKSVKTQEKDHSNAIFFSSTITVSYTYMHLTRRKIYITALAVSTTYALYLRSRDVLRCPAMSREVLRRPASSRVVPRCPTLVDPRHLVCPPLR